MNRIAFGINGIAFSAEFLLGPVVGGALTAITWRLVFLINVPIGIIGTLWGVLKLREPVQPLRDQHFDWIDSLTFTIGLSSLLLANSLYAFPIIGIDVVCLLLAGAVAALASFVVVERRVTQPMIDLHLFKNQSFTYASIANALNGLAGGAVLFVLTFFLQGPYGYDPPMAGILLASYGASFLFIGPISGHLSDRYGECYLATAGLLISSVGLLCLTTVMNTTPY